MKWELEVPKKALHQIFEESCAQYDDRPFTDFLDKVMTFRDYKEASDKAAAGFQKLGVKPGVNVGLYLPNTPHYALAFFAVLKAGGTVVNFSPLDAVDVVRHKIADSQTQRTGRRRCRRIGSIDAAASPTRSAVTTPTTIQSPIT